LIWWQIIIIMKNYTLTNRKNSCALVDVIFKIIDAIMQRNTNTPFARELPYDEMRWLCRGWCLVSLVTTNVTNSMSSLKSENTKRSPDNYKALLVLLHRYGRLGYTRGSIRSTQYNNLEELTINFEPVFPWRLA
jgi:hypothetical protein